MNFIKSVFANVHFFFASIYSSKTLKVVPVPPGVTKVTTAIGVIDIERPVTLLLEKITWYGVMIRTEVWYDEERDCVLTSRAVSIQN